MKFFHLSDLHLGKKVNGYSMIEDQKYILKAILNSIDEYKPDAVIIAGDVYDKSIPSTEAVELFDDYLVSLSQREVQVFIISGNHDSPERLAFGNKLIDRTGIHISPVYNGELVSYEMEDEYGKVRFYLLPFIRPSNVRRFFPEEELTTYTDAVRIALSAVKPDTSFRNVMIAHQFITGASVSESEEISVGTVENVDASVFEEYDYVALGHIHGPQRAGGDMIRYCGTPLKYSTSEASQKKSITCVELREKGNVNITTIPLIPLRDLAVLRGRYDELMAKSFYENTTYCNDYVHITLTDEDDIPEVISKLRVVYKNLLNVEYDNRRTRHDSVITGAEQTERKTPAELFSDFFREQNGYDMSEKQTGIVNALIEEIWGDEI